MRTRTTHMFRVALVSLSLGILGAVAPRTAQAEADRFGIGDGHRLAFTATAVDVVNAYAPLTVDAAANATTLTFAAPIGNLTPPIGTANGFTAGDLAMVWRATGVAANAPEVASGNQGRVDLASNALEAGRVGTFEFVRVQAATPTTVTLTKGLVSAWAKDVTQIVRVPEFTTVAVPAGTRIAATAWQSVGTGFAGGLVAFLANGAVTIDGAIDASAAGFRGGRKDSASDASLSCANLDGTEATGYAAKGEGIVSTAFGGANQGGRGNRANGAGGGNCLNNGGGGGGGFGSGGAGGNSVVAQERSGLGGVGVDYSLLSRFTMGGGGGAGEQKNGVGSGGGAGGGVIFVRARSLAGAGELRANGETAANAGPFGINASDGAGGGGGGGAIVIRAVQIVACGSAQTNGGNGGDTSVIGLGPFGAGGGGGGGRILIQSANSAGCATSFLPGTGGQSGAAGAAGSAGQGEPVPAPGGNYCFTNAPTDPQCANPAPVCDPTTGFCNKCTAPFGSAGPGACNVEVMPVCLVDGTCNPCDGDLGSGAARACQLGAAPYCFLTGATTGACGKCTTNADCGPGHGGVACAPGVGACGAPCTTDAECKGSEWCAQQVCVPKTPNSQALPSVTPIDGECTKEKGMRVCLSAVCEEDDDLCGLKNGSPCDGVNEKCRSTTCFPGDKKCGKPTGEPCTAAGECRSNDCTSNVCTGCDDDSDCATGKVCDKDKKQCVDGCREVGGKSGCLPPQECSMKDGTIGQCIDQPDGGGGGGGGDAGPSDAGLVEGGGCACRTSMPISGSPLALAAALAGALLLVRRRSQRTKDADGAKGHR